MELTQEQMNAIVKGYEAFPVALGAMTEQLNEMNGFLKSIVTKQEREDEEERKACDEEKLRKQVERELKKQLKKGDLISEESPSLRAKPQSEGQDTIEGGG